jgi:hypothetical protein
VAIAIHASLQLIRAYLVIGMAGWELGLGISSRIYAQLVALNWLMKLAKAIAEK